MKKLLALIVISLIFTVTPLKTETEAKTHKPPEKSREELYQDIFISLLKPQIDKQTNKYYKNVLTQPPLVYPYFVFVEKAERLGTHRSFDFLITLKVYPVVGPHINVGLDKFVFRVKGSGSVELKEFVHIKDFELPGQWKHYKK